MRAITAMTSAILLWVSGCQSETGPASAHNLITADRILSHVEVLAGDSMQGRGTGTQGEARAADYISGQFQELGLVPVGESFLQPVQLVGMQRREEGSSIEITGKDGPLDLTAEENITYWSSSRQPVVRVEEAPLVFVGYGVQAPEYEWDDFKDFDPRGKVLLFLNDDPPVIENQEALFGGEARTYYGRWIYKFEQAMRLGAAGALMIHTTESASYPFSVVQKSGAGQQFALDLPGTGYQVDVLGWLDSVQSEQIARAMGASLKELFQMAAERDFRPRQTGFSVTATITTAIESLQTHNVVGLLPGSDPELRDQVVVFSAHFDHLGVDPTQPGEDKIFNGAWDNAAGTASILTLAQAFSGLGTPPRRSLLFLACTAEEKGLLGSAWFTARPPLPLKRLVANFNIDMPQIFGVTADIAAIGHDSSSLGADLKQAAARFAVEGRSGVAVVGDINPGAGSFYRSDQLNFAKKGITALYLNPGREYLQELEFDPVQYRTDHYHQVSDQVNARWDLAGAQRDMRLVFETALITANKDERPRWNPGNEFEAAWKALYGP